MEKACSGLFRCIEESRDLVVRESSSSQAKMAGTCDDTVDLLES